MGLKAKYLEKFKNENILADFYTDNYEESDFGFVIDFNDDYLLIESFDSDCKYDGIITFLRQDVTRIRWFGNEIESVHKVIDLSKRQKEKIDIDLTSIRSILESVQALYNHITVYIQDVDKDVCFIGQIHEIDDETVVIHEFGSKISLDRKFIILSLNDITKISANGHYENILMKLFEV